MLHATLVPPKHFSSLLLFLACSWLFAAGLQAKTFTVTNNNDTGGGSLRASIDSANSTPGKDTIDFAIGSGTVAGRSITISSTLPILSEGVVIDGTTQNNGSAFGISDAKIHVHNDAFVDPTFRVQAPNTEIYGIHFTAGIFGSYAIEASNSNMLTVGSPGKGNSFNDNGDGAIHISNFHQAVVQNNIIGPTPSGGTPSGNGQWAGILIDNGSTRNVIKNNEIAYNDRYSGIEINSASRNVIFQNDIHDNDDEGVLIDGGNADSNQVSHNSFYCNGVPGISLANGSNQGKTPPTITSSSSSSVSGTASAGDTIEFFMNDTICNECAGKSFMGETVADGSGNWTINGSFPLGNYVATATDDEGNTSAFTSCEFINPNGNPCAIEGDYSVFYDHCLGYDTARFTDESNLMGSGSINSWTWAFGDGDTSTVQNPKHLYDTAGVHRVTLITSAAGCADTLQRNFTVKDTCVQCPINPAGKALEDWMTYQMSGNTWSSSGQSMSASGAPANVWCAFLQQQYPDSCNQGTSGQSMSSSSGANYNYIQMAHQDNQGNSCTFSVETYWDEQPGNGGTVDSVDLRPHPDNSNPGQDSTRYQVYIYHQNAPPTIGEGVTSCKQVFCDCHLSTSLDTLVDPTCDSLCDGRITVQVDSTTDPADILWDKGDTTWTIDSLCEDGYHYTARAGGCQSKDSVILDAPPNPNPMINKIPETCDGVCDGSIEIAVDSAWQPLLVDWGNGDTTALTDSLCSGIYEYTATANKCPISDTVYVASDSIPEASFTHDPKEDFGELTVDFTNTSDDAPYSWLFGDGQGSSATSPTHTYTDTGLYNIMLIAGTSPCSDTATGMATVLPTSVTIPNVFTPNGDGSNDSFAPELLGAKSAQGKIYNRWGQLLYEWDKVTGSWDGTTQAGREAPEGTYYFTLNVEWYEGVDIGEKEYTGTVTLLRNTQ